MGLKSQLLSLDGITVIENEPMKKHLSMGVGGCATYFISVKSIFALTKVISLLSQKGIPYKILGNGTNVIVSENGFNGAIISLKELNDITFVRNGINVMAGVNLNKLISYVSKMNLGGLHNLYNIPSTVGGAISMNCGAYNCSVSDCVIDVQTVKNGKLKSYDKSECKFNYRTSRFRKSKEIIVSATFLFYDMDSEEIDEKISVIKQKRAISQPNEKSSGCIFKNTDGLSMGKLIDMSNLKGLTVGGAKVSDKHSNFIVNTGNATAKDVYDLSHIVKNIVREKYGIDMQYEVEFLGEF